MTTNYHDKYLERLQSIPAPGGGGCHIDLLGVANLGVKAGLSPQQVHADIQSNIPTGRRRVTDKEIQDAVEKAFTNYHPPIKLPGGTTYHRYTPPKPKPIIMDGQATLKKITEQGKYSDEVDLWESSPIRLWDVPELDAILFLNTLFNPDDLVWTGERYDTGIPEKNLMPVKEWLILFHLGKETSPFIIINPLTGESAPTKAGGGETFRGDGNIAAYHHCLIEFDNLSREDQIKFWSAVKLPIRALIDTGGKSIHAWIDVQKLADVKTADQWDREIKARLYDQLLRPLGVDAACSNAARLSRLPGHFRTEKGNWQRFLWLSPEGRSVL